MFRAAFLYIIRSSWPYIGVGTFYVVLMTLATSFGDRLLPGAGWNWISILLLVANGHKTA